MGVQGFLMDECVLTRQTKHAASKPLFRGRPRVYTDDAENYPTTGTKEIEMNRWFEQVHGRHETFVSNTLADIDTVFPDAELIGKLGCGSVINLPVILGGKMVATVNILHEEGYYTPERVAQAHEVLRLPSMAVLALAS